jgi:hypothetical protein
VLSLALRFFEIFEMNTTLYFNLRTHAMTAFAVTPSGHYKLLLGLTGYRHGYHHCGLSCDCHLHYRRRYHGAALVPGVGG